MAHKMYDLVVIGGGPVGLYATFLAGLLQLETICLEIDETLGGQATKLYPFKKIHDYPGHLEIKATDLMDIFTKQAINNEYTKIQTKTNIIRYEVKNNIVILYDQNNNEYHAKNVLLTVGPGGFEPMKLTNDMYDEISKPNIFYTHDITKDLTNKNVVVLGGGDSATDYACQFKEQFPNCNVTLIHRGDKLRSIVRTLDDLKQANVNVILDAQLVNIQNNKCVIEKDSNIISIPFDYSLVQYGLKPLGSNVHKWEEFLKNKNKFVVNELQQTSVNYFYAAGNCCYNPSKVDLITIGMGEAAIIINKIYKEIKN